MSERPAAAVSRVSRAGRSKRARGRGARRARPPLGREDWILAARATLIRDGINAVNVLPLAHKLRVTRGGFYWHFRNRADLLDALLSDWEASNTAALEHVLSEGRGDGHAEFAALVDVWLEESAYDPAWDAAVRQWALQAPAVARVVKRVDERRIELIRQIFVDLGYHDPEALVRARITYFHQVGYYLLGLGETPAERRRLLPHYLATLKGKAR
jgi:AcrR family transcriptional regulator